MCSCKPGELVSAKTPVLYRGPAPQQRGRVLFVYMQQGQYLIILSKYIACGNSAYIDRMCCLLIAVSLCFSYIVHDRWCRLGQCMYYYHGTTTGSQRHTQGMPIVWKPVSLGAFHLYCILFYTWQGRTLCCIVRLSCLITKLLSMDRENQLTHRDRMEQTHSIL